MEVKIIKRGNFYLTPFTKEHVKEVVDNLSAENVREINLLGYTNIKECIEEMMAHSDCYLVRKEGEIFTAISGLWYENNVDTPQFFAMFSRNIKKNFTSMARGSRMLVNFFDRSQDEMSMRILSDHQFMLDWASWLGFEAVGITKFNSNHYVDFVRCNLPQKSAYSETSRPVMH
jgi:hypothetical protein